LTEGYLSGVFDFKHKNPWSRIREDVILYNLERKKFGEVYKIATVMHSTLISGMQRPSVSDYDVVTKLYEAYRNAELPYQAKNSKMKLKDAKEVEDEWMSLINQRNKREPKTI